MKEISMEIFNETFRSLLANKTRTLLSMLGIIIGVMAMIAVVAIGQGSTSNITERVSALGSNVMIVSAGFSGGSGGRAATALTEILSLRDVDNFIEYCPDIAKASPVLQRSFTAQAGANSYNAQVTAGNESLYSILDLKLSSGRFINEDDEINYTKNIVIGYSVAENLFENADPLGQTVLISYRVGRTRLTLPVTVIGVMEKTGTKLMYNIDRMILMPYSSAESRLFFSNGRVDSVLITTKSAEGSARAKAQIQHLMYNKLQDSRKFNITSMDEIMGTVSEVTSVLNLFLGAIAGISLLVGGIGIMNIMLVSVSERTREIGIKKAIGATRKRILLEFMIESIFITVIAGLIGVIGGIGVSEIVKIVGKEFNLTPVVSFQSIVVAFGFASLIGMFFGIYPASKASKLSPVEALRNE
jgi:putative ABC transport system permease protein